MADIIELEIVGKVTNLKPMLSTVSRLEREIIKSTKALDQNKISQDRYNKVLLSAKREYMALGTSAQKASGQVERMAKSATLASAAQSREITLNKQYAVARREATAANARHTAATKQSNALAAQALVTEERLKNKFIQGYSAMDIYTKELNDLAMARKADIITVAQQSAAVERLNLQMSKGTGAFAAYGGGVAGATQKQSRLGVVAQQSGYQVGDFLVQIQSGANPMMAFGQQATQLVGVMSLFGGKMLFAGAALGIIIPLLTAVAGFFLRSRKAAKDAAGGLDTFEERLKSAREEVKGMADDLKLMNSGFRDTTELTLNEAVEAAVESLKEARAEVAELTSEAALMGLGASGGIDLGGLFRGDPLKAAEERLATAREELLVLRELSRQATERERNESVTNQLLEVRETQQREAYEAGKEAYEQRQELIAEGLANISDVSQAAANAAAEVNEKWDTFFETVNNIRSSLGEAAFEALRISGVDMSGPIDDAMKEAAELAGELGISYELAKDINDANLDDGILDGVKAAQALATSLGLAFDIAAAIANQTPSAGRGRGQGPQGPSLGEDVAGAGDLYGFRGQLNNLYTPDDKSGSSGNSSGGGSQSSDQLDFVEALRAEMVVREQLVGLYGDEYELQSEIARIVKGLGEDSGDYNAQAIEALAQQNILLKEQEVLRDEAAAQMENIYKMLGNEIGAFTTAMISDTKSVEDAFKSMAKNIIDQLIQIFIVEQMVNSISGGGGILGGLFGGGASTNSMSGPMTSSIRPQMRAGGGPVTEGMPYIVGENEPELFVPKSSGNIYNQKQMANMGKGNGGDTVVIHQKFNFQANGDDSVKKLIQQAAPQIAQMTKSSMLNDRRRGGQTKAVFG
jgi:hypothetical protein